MFIEFNNVYYLRGIVSASLYDLNFDCDVHNFALYTNAFKFTEWIRNIWYLEIKIESRQEDFPKWNSSECGIMSAPMGLIQGGSFASQELFPWTVAVYNIKVPPGKNNRLNTGTLISNRHVIVDGNFVALSNIDLHPAERFYMYFGAYDLDLKTNDDVILTGVSKIIIHENFDRDKIPNEANIAILIADRVIKFSSHIQPACLPTYRNNSDDIIGSFGYAASWGYDESKTQTKLKKFIQMKIDKKSRCNYSYGDRLSTDYSSEFFCLSSNSSATPCIDDGPFYMKTSDRWHLRGLMGIIRMFPNGTCNPNYPVLVEDAAFYSKWISTKISQF